MGLLILDRSLQTASEVRSTVFVVVSFVNVRVPVTSVCNMNLIRTFFLIGMCLMSASTGASAHAQADEMKMPVSFGDVLKLASPAPATEILYGDSPLQTVLRYPASGEALADVVLIHGGCWSADYDRGHALPLAGALREAGFDVWVPEYRRVGDAGGGWPGSWHDIVGAIQKVAGERTADRPLIAIGHSAGGHLALLAASRSDLSLTHVVGLAPIADLTAYGRGDNSCQTMTPQFMGGSPDAVDYSVASPSDIPLSVPVTIIQGDADPIVPPSQAATVPDARVVAVPNAGHFDLIHPATAAFPVLLRVLKEATQ